MRTVSGLIVVGLAFLTACERDTELTVGSTSTASTSSPSTAPPTAATTTTLAPVSTSSPASTSIEPPSTAPTTTTTTTAPSTSAEPTTTAAPTTTLTPGPCSAPPALPAGSVESASELIDADADSLPDIVRTYAIDDSPAAGDWHVRVELAAGGGVDLAIADDPAPAAVRLLGAVYIGSTVEPGPGGLRPAIFVVTGAGASTSIVTLFRLDGCSLVAMGGTPFAVGASVTHAENLRCEGVAGTSLLVYEQIQLSGDSTTFDVTDTPYTRMGNDLSIYGAGPQTINQPTMPAVPTLIDCQGVDQP